MLCCHHAIAFPALARAAQSSAPSPPNRLFVPSYDFQPIPVGVSVPSGLEVKLVLQKDQAAAGSVRFPRLARIPSTWRLQLWLGSIFARISVSRNTTVESIEKEAARQLGARKAAKAERLRRRDGQTAATIPEPQCTVELLIRSRGSRIRLPPAQSAEAAELFTHQATHALVAKSTCG